MRARRDSGAATSRMLREMGIFGPGIPTLREILDTGQRTVEELVDRYPIACRPVRNLIVDYLKERQPAIDCVTLDHRAQLARSFWPAWNGTTPASASLRLPRDVASAWKQRLATRTTTTTTATGVKTAVTVERLGYVDTLASVRASTWTWPNGRWTTRPGGVRGWPRAPSGQKTWRDASSPVVARPGWTPGPVSGCRSCRSWPAPPPNPATTPRPAGRRPAGPDRAEEFTAAGQTLIRSVRPHGDPRQRLGPRSG